MEGVFCFPPPFQVLEMGEIKEGVVCGLPIQSL